MLKKRSLSLAKTEPSSALSPFEEFERRFEEFFRRPFSLMEAPWWTRWPALAGEVYPTADIYEEGGDIDVARSEEEARHLNRLLRTVTEIDQAIVRQRDTDGLLRDACRILAEQGGFLMCRI